MNEMTKQKRAVITVNHERPEFVNKQLEAITKTAEATWEAGEKGIKDTARRTMVSLARQFANVEANECFKEDGFESARDYVEKTFGCAHAWASALIQVGKAINNGEIPENLDVSFDSMRLLASKKVDSKKLIESGEVHDGMSKEQIKNAISKDTETDEAKEPNPARKAKSYVWNCISKKAGKFEATEDEILNDHDFEWTRKIKACDKIYIVACNGNAATVYERMGEVVEAEE